MHDKMKAIARFDENLKKLKSEWPNPEWNYKQLHAAAHHLCSEISWLRPTWIGQFAVMNIEYQSEMFKWILRPVFDNDEEYLKCVNLMILSCGCEIDTTMFYALIEIVFDTEDPDPDYPYQCPINFEEICNALEHHNMDSRPAIEPVNEPSYKFLIQNYDWMDNETKKWLMTGVVPIIN